MTEEKVQRLRLVDTLSSTYSVEEVYQLIKSKRGSIEFEYRLFYKVIKAFVKVILIKLFEGYSILLPSNLGLLYISKRKTGVEVDDNFNITKRIFYLDRLKTKENKGKKVFLMNIDYIIRMKWKKSNMKNKSLFYFTPNKSIKKKLWEIANTNNLLIINKYRDGK